MKYHLIKQKRRIRRIKIKNKMKTKKIKLIKLRKKIIKNWRKEILLKRKAAHLDFLSKYKDNRK